MSIVMSVNAGSSSLKFQVFKMPEEEVLAQGNVERIGLNDSIFGMKANGEKIEEILDIKRRVGEKHCGFKSESEY